MQTKKRKHSTDSVIIKQCCTKLSVFACVCAIVSLLVNAYSYFDRKHVDDIHNFKNILEDRIEEKLAMYLNEMTGTSSQRLKREAMLVCSLIKFNTQV